MNTERPPSADRPVIGSPRHILLKPHQIINISSNHRHLHTNLVPGIIPLTKKHRILLDESRIRVLEALVTESILSSWL